MLIEWFAVWRLDIFSCRLLCRASPLLCVVTPAVLSSGVDIASGFGTLTFDKPDVVTFRDNTISRTVVDPVRLMVL